MKQVDIAKLVADAVAAAVKGSAIPTSAPPAKALSADLVAVPGSFTSKKGTVETLNVHYKDGSAYQGVTKAKTFWAAVVMDLDKGSQSAIRRALSGR